MVQGPDIQILLAIRVRNRIQGCYIRIQHFGRFSGQMCGPRNKSLTCW